MPADEPKGQHFVHRAYLEGFQDTELEQRGRPALWVYMPGRSPFPQRPERVAKRNYYYCYEREERRRFEVEHDLQKLEDAALPVLQLIRQQSFDLSPDNRMTFAGYIALSHARVPTFQRAIDRIASLESAQRIETITNDREALLWVTKKLSEETGEPVDPDEFQRKLTAGSAVVGQGNRDWSLGQMFQAMIALQQTISRMSWRFMIASENDPGFLTTDNPVAVFDPLRGPLEAIGFASSPAAHFTFPISRELCLLADHRGAPTTTIKVSASVVRNMNKTAISRADTQLYAPFRSDKVQSLLDESVQMWKRDRKVLLRKGRVVKE